MGDHVRDPIVGKELKQAGLATHYVSSVVLPQLVAALATSSATLHSEATVDATISTFEACSSSPATIVSDQCDLGALTCT